MIIKNKGTISLSINSLISIILVMLVLAVMLGIQYHLIFHYSKPLIDKKVIDSMNGLVCALASVANNYILDPEYCNSKMPRASYSFAHASPEDVVEYGNVKVYCKPQEKECIVENFNLPQKIDKKDIFSYIFSYGDPKYLVYYEIFPRGEERAWIQQGDKDVIALALISGLLNLPVTDILKTGEENLINSLFKKNLQKETEKEVIEKPVEEASKDLMEKEAISEFIEGNDKNEISKLLENTGEREEDSITKLRNGQYEDLIKEAKDEESKKKLEKIIIDYELYKDLGIEEIKNPADEEFIRLIDNIAEKGGLEYDPNKKIWILNNIGKRVIEERIKSLSKPVLEDLENKVMKEDVKDILTERARNRAKNFLYRISRSKTTMLALTSQISTIADEDPKAKEIEGFAKCNLLVKGSKLRGLCLLAFLWGYLSVRVDMLNEKYKNAGYNTLAVYSPYYFLHKDISIGKDLAMIIPLPKKLEKYVLILDKDKDMFLAEQFRKSKTGLESFKELDTTGNFQNTQSLKEDSQNSNTNIEEPYKELGRDDIRFYLASPCKADLHIRKVKLNIEVPVCGFWADNIKDIRNNYKNGIKGFIWDVCINGNLDMFADQESKENAIKFCSCIPDNIKKGILKEIITKGVSIGYLPKKDNEKIIDELLGEIKSQEKNIEDIVVYKENQQLCEAFLENPAILFFNGVDKSCYNGEEKILFYNAEDMKKLDMAYSSYQQNFCDNSHNAISNPNICIHRKINHICTGSSKNNREEEGEIKDIENYLHDVSSLTYKKNVSLEEKKESVKVFLNSIHAPIYDPTFLLDNWPKDKENISKLQKCYYSPNYYKDNINLNNLKNKELEKIIKDLFMEGFDPIDDSKLVIHLDKENNINNNIMGEGDTGRLDIISGIPIDKNLWENLQQKIKSLFGDKETMPLTINAIIITVDKEKTKEGEYNFCYTPYHNNILRSIVIWAPFVALDVGAGTFTGGIGAEAMHFLTGSIPIFIENYFDQKAKWPTGK